MRKRLNPDLQDFRINRISNNPVGARLALALKYAHSFTTQTNGEHTMRTPLKSIATAALTRPLPILFILLIGAIGVQTITSCSGGADDLPCVTCGDDGGGGGASEGPTYTYGIKDLTDSSFTEVNKWYKCQEDGTLKEETTEHKQNYSINGTILSFQGLEFSGNSNSLIGTWTREPSSASCDHNDHREGDEYCEYSSNGISKAVFTQNSYTLTECAAGKKDEEYEDDDGIITKWKVIDCGTVEWTKGTEPVIIKFFGTGKAYTVTYNGKTCEDSQYSEYSVSQMRTACTEAYNKATAEGYDGNGNLVRDYYEEIFRKNFDKCLKDNNFPEWIN